MQSKLKNAVTKLLAGILIGSAFIAGAQLRSWQGASDVLATDEAKTYALLKLTPESSPMPLDEAAPNQGKSESKELVSSVLRLLKAHYVEPITPERQNMLARGAVQGMLDQLSDPDSRFLDPKERKLLDDAGAGRFHGIGTVFALRNEKVNGLDVTKLLVVSPMPGSPAEKAGLKAGDSITYIDSKWIITHDPFKEAGMEKLLKQARNKEIDEFTYQKAYEAAFKKLKEGIQISDALETLTIKDSGQVSLQVDRPGQKDAVKLKMKCGRTQVAPVATRSMKNGITYIKVTQFSKDAIRNFRAQLDKAKARNTTGLILDLRNNPGGLMEAATDITGRITGGGVIATIQEKHGTEKKIRTVRAPKSQKLDVPVVVLVNAGTSSVAELVAGTLRDSRAATLIGTRTFGDGLIQTPLLLKDGSAAVLTTGKMLTVNGTDFEGKGLAPDKEVFQGRAGDDDQLTKAEAVLLAKLGKA